MGLTGLFNAHVQLFVQEVQGLWQRFNIMLLANAVVFGFFTRAGDRRQVEVWGGTLFGLLLCAAWAVMLRNGWRYQNIYEDAAKRFAWTGLHPHVNPLVHLDVQRSAQGFRRGQTRCLGFFVIGLFALGYVLFAIYHVCIQKPPAT